MTHTRRPLIVRDSKAILVYKGSHIEVRFKDASPVVIGFVQISEIYIHQSTHLSIQLAMQLARKVPLHFIDARGNVCAELKSY